MASSSLNSPSCPACSSSSVSVFFSMPDMPTYVNFLWPTAEEALGCTRGDIELGFCADCGLISNVAFDESKLEYREGYENSLHFSDVFQAYAGRLADELIRRYELRGKTIIEIGCGRGDFLILLAERGANHGLGFDPSHPGPPDGAPTDRVRFIKDFYNERYAGEKADFICSRHTLEHVRQPQDMLGPLRRSIGDRSGTVVFFEVPNARYTLRNLFIWDIIYEHTSYFTAPALQRLFEQAGFRVVRTYEEFDGQYLCLEAYPGSSREVVSAADFEPLSRDIESFRRRYDAYVEGWRDRLAALAREGRRAVLWGAGSKGVTFLNLFRDAATVDRVVDVNPNKHGMHIAGAGQPIVAPEALSGDPPDCIIIANPIYKDEIARMTASLGLNPEFLHL